jgi:NADP-dependent 3-hydroxy acid dehydrogenase YdfG
MEQLGLEHAMCRGVDVVDEAAVASSIEEAERRFGPVGLLVNNAGIMPLGDVISQHGPDIQRVFDVNCVAPLKIARLVLPGMIERRRGTIVNLGSIAGRGLYDKHTVYCGTKFAIHAMSEGLRREVAPYGVRVVNIAPGLVTTELLSSTRSEQVRKSYQSYVDEVGGGLEADEIAKVVQFVYELPENVCVRELVLSPTAQAV